VNLVCGFSFHKIFTRGGFCVNFLKFCVKGGSIFVGSFFLAILCSFLSGDL
jgi:hypothetical protein